MSKKICSFISNSAQDFSFVCGKELMSAELKKRLRKEIEKQISENEVCHFVSGMDIGADMYAAEIVVALKDIYPHITLEVAIPYEEQATKWSERERDKYFSLIEKCDMETLLSRHYTEECVYKRNKYMIDKSDVVITIRDSTIRKIVEYAKNAQKDVIVIEK